ncbi:MAG: hypothetical protein IKK21_09985 [Clostridia bacterium]|nr:hypothetical protein [Clostridia bacterium]
MKLKRLALRGLVILLVGVALCMFFARTVQTITTPKVRLYSPGQGRLEQEITLTAEVYFPEREEFFIAEAKESAVTVEKVNVQPGSYVYAGDVIFTALLPTYEEDMKTLRTEYDAKAQELTDLDILNRKLSRESRQNELYEEMIDAQDALSDKSYAARSLALAAGVTLAGEEDTWKKQLSAVPGVTEDVFTAVDEAVAAKKTFDAARDAFYEVYENKKLRVSDEVFEYIKQRTKLTEEMQELSDKMLALDARAKAVSEVRAPRSGWVIAVNVAVGDSYDGLKAAYVMNAEGTQAVLRANMTGIDRTIPADTRVTIKSTNNEERTKTTGTMVGEDDTKYLLMALTDSMALEDSVTLRQLLREGSVEAVMTHRAAKSATLLPVSAVRTDGNEHYVYVVGRTQAGFMSGTGYTAVKTTVTVLDRNDKQIAVAEDLTYQDVAYQEDRALTDGCAVMEYVN